MGSFNILYDDVKDFQWKCKSEMEALIKICESASADILKFSSLSSFQGQTAESAKLYVEQVHGGIIKAISIIAQEFIDQIARYKYGYDALGEPALYTLPQSTIESAKSRFSSEWHATSLETTRIKNALHDISDIFYVAPPSVSTVESEHTQIEDTLKTFIENVIKHEDKDTPTNLEMLSTLLDKLSASLKECTSKNPSEITSYTDGDFYRKQSSTELAYYSTACYNYHEQVKDELDKVWEYEDQVEKELQKMAEERKSQGVWQMIGGVALVVVGVVCIVGTAGAATPIVVAGGVAGGGTIIFGEAELLEGGHNVYLGSIGDISTPSINPVRDTVFLGNQEVYDKTKNAFAFTASALTPIGKASVAGNLTIRSGAYMIGEVVISDAAGNLTSEGVTKVCEYYGVDPNIT